MCAMVLHLECTRKEAGLVRVRLSPKPFGVYLDSSSRIPRCDADQMLPAWLTKGFGGGG